jgi:PAS domain S-box-containing protein
MEVKMEKTADEVKRLQSCINDLISVLALPAIWSGNESSQIIGTLLDVLLAMLRLDFAYARLSDPSGAPPIEVVRLTQREHPSAQPQEVGRALDRWLSGDQTTSRYVVPNPAGEGEVSIASFSLGLQDKVGVLVAGSRRADFPTVIERLLLRVAANQTGIGLQEARRSDDQKRVAEALERRVAERTRELTAVNEGLRRSEAYLAEAQRLSHTGSFGWRLSTGEILWSEETFRMFQYDQTTKPTMELVLQRVHPEDATFVKQTIERASSDGKDFDHEYRLLMPDGSVKYVHVVARAVSDELGGIEFVGAVMDITEQHQSRAALERAFGEIKKSESQLQLVIDTIPGMVWSGLPDGTFDFVNEPWLRYLGCSWEELSARGGLVSVVHPDDVEESVDSWNVTRATGRHTDHELRMRRADGEYRWFLTRALPLRDEMGNIIKWYGTATDIEDRKLAEEEQKRGAEALRQAEADLAHVSRATTMGELTASLAHEVNQPIAAAVTNANTCVRWLANDIPNIQEARDAAIRSAKDGTRAAEIISRIRLLFKKGTTDRELLDVNEVIREMIVLLRGEATRYSVSIQTDLAPDLPQLLADRVQLQQIMLNLIMNSIDAMKDVGGTRELAIRSQRAENEHLMISVSDTGVGLPGQQADEMFNAFFTTKLQGTGLGLSISRSIVESHGGRLWAADNPPRGASFYFTLPTKAEAHE